MSHAEAAPARWIVSAPYDITWFFGGAALSLLVLALYLAGAPILALWWAWILFFDGPHIAAAFTRTYLDTGEWRTRRSALLSSLLAFVVGPACLLLTLPLGSPDPFLLFLALSAFYGYYHVVRQHYGFLSLYRAVGDERDQRRFALDRWTLYVGCWAPYVYFLLSHPRARAVLRLAPGDPSAVERVLMVAAVAAWALAVGSLLVRTALTRERVVGPRSTYLFVTLGLYSLIYFAVARMEPAYARSNGPDQDFLLLSVLVTVFHNVQYLGLVWFHNRNRYRAAGGFGPAGWLNRTPALYLASCVLFSVVVYAASACSTGVFPGCAVLLDARVGPFSANQLGLCLWWGLAINHYYLDQKIWRVGSDPELRRNLGLA
jgi:hypothetical protein